MSQECYKVAVIGTGSAGMRHARVLQQMLHAQVIVVPKRPERAKILQDAGYSTAQDLDEAVSLGANLCIIASDTNEHVKNAFVALELGLDILVEKPLAANASEAYQLAQQASSAGRLLYVGYVLRFSESLNVFRNWLEQIGARHSLVIECRSYLPDWRPDRSYLDSYSAREQDGGALRDLSHEVDYAVWLFGKPTAVYGNLRNLGRLSIDADESAEIFWESPDGCPVYIGLDYLTRPARRGIKACGELGNIEWDGIANSVTLSLVGRPEKNLVCSQTLDEMFSAQATAFMNSIRGLPDSQLASGLEGSDIMAVCDTARLSAKSHRQEPVYYQ